MLAGAYLSRAGLIDKTLRQGLNKLLFYFVLPVMVFTSMQGNMTRELLSSSYIPVIFGSVMCFVNLGLAQLLSKVFNIPKEERRLMSFLNMFGNNLYLGVPIALAVFGADGVAVVLLYSFGSDMVLWTYGQMLLSPRDKFTSKDLKQVFTPTLIGLVLGTLAGVTGLSIPSALTDALGNVASIASPMALILTGAALAEINYSTGLISRQVPALLLGRLVLSPASAALGLTLFKVDPVVAVMVVITAAMPTFVRSIVLTDQYGWSGQHTAMGVMVTTLGSFFTVPLLVQFLSR